MKWLSCLVPYFSSFLPSDPFLLEVLIRFFTIPKDEKARRIWLRQREQLLQLSFNTWRETWEIFAEMKMMFHVNITQYRMAFFVENRNHEHGPFVRTDDPQMFDCLDHILAW